MYQRDLTPSENRVLELLKQLEALIIDGKLVGRVVMADNALSYFRDNKVAKSLRIIRSKEDNKKFVVTMDIPEFKKYVEHFCDRVGFTVGIDGSVTTFDGLTLSEEEDH